MDIRVEENPAATVAEMLVEAAERGSHIVLTGGSTPKLAYETAAAFSANWNGSTIWFSDERCVPPESGLSNFRMATDALLGRIMRDQRPAVMRMEGELGHEAAAGAYEALLREHFGSDPRFDLVLLGMGPDAHVASLFPGKPELEETRRLAVGVPIAGMEPQVPRVTLTLPVLNRAHQVAFLISGAGKAQAVARAFGDPPDPDAPAARVRPQDGSLYVFVDEAAAAAL